MSKKHAIHPVTAAPPAAGPPVYTAALLFLAVALTLLPWKHDFPVNDDWAYALGVKHFLEQGRLIFSDWAAATQVLHTLAGVLNAKIFGFSFAALRVQNVFFAAAGVWVFSKLLDEFDLGPYEKLAAALAVSLNPLYLLLANSFMTDIPYLLFMMLSVYCGALYLKTGLDRHLFWLSFFSAGAFLIRQLAVAIPLALSAALLFQGRPRVSTLLKAWALPLAAMGGYFIWFKYAHGPTWASENYVLTSTLGHLLKPAVFLSDSLYRTFSALLATGLLLLPASAGTFSGFFFRSGSKGGTDSRARGWLVKEGPWLALAVFVVFVALTGALPRLENNLSRNGLGVLTLSGAALKPSGFFSSDIFWFSATGLSAVSAAILLCASGLALRGSSPALRFVCLSAAFHLAVSLAGAKFFDRYLLPLLPWFALSAVLAARSLKFSKPAAAAALALAALVSWAGVKDYLSWNKAKWDLAARPAPGLQPEEIVNGFDYEGWLTYDRNMAYLKTMKPLKMIGEWEWQKMNNYKAIISFGRNPELEAMDQIEYSTPLSLKKGVLYLSRQK